MAQLMPLPLTVSCSSRIQIGFTFLIPAHLGSPGKGPLNRCVLAASEHHGRPRRRWRLSVTADYSRSTFRSEASCTWHHLAPRRPTQHATAASAINKPPQLIADMFCAEPRARFTKYLTTILRLSYDNAKVMIDLRQTSHSQNILRRTQGFSRVQFACKIVKSSEIVFVH